MPLKTEREQPEAYRCVSCGNGRQLAGWAHANVYGDIDAKGDVADGGIWEDWLIEESIRCKDHPDGIIEKMVDGAWCRWWWCQECGGKGRVLIGESYHAPNGYSCSGKAPAGLHRDEFSPGHQGWLPVTAAD